MKYSFEINELDPENGFGKVLSQINPGAIVLECGCATGYMTRYMKEKLNCHVSIIEIEKDAYEIACQYADDGICADLMGDEWCEKFRGKRFDYVLFCDVLEHVYDPAALLKKAAQFLKQDGKMIVSLPNILHNDILIKMYEGRWDYQDRGLLDNTHIHFWGVRNIESFFEDAGLKVTIFNATWIPTGRTEQYWGEECRVDPEFLDMLYRRRNGTIYQFILTAQTKQYVEKNNVKTVYHTEAFYQDQEFPTLRDANEIIQMRSGDEANLEQFCKAAADSKQMFSENIQQITRRVGRIQQANRMLAVQNTELSSSVNRLSSSNYSLATQNADLMQNIHQLQMANNALTEQNNKLTEQNGACEDVNKELEEKATSLTQRASQLERELKQQTNEKEDALNRANAIEQELAVANSYVQAINESRAHRMAEKYYSVRDKVFPVGSKRRRIIGRIVHGTTHLLHPAQPEPEQPKNQIDRLHDMGKYNRMDVITTQHCIFIAKLVKRALERVGIACTIHMGEPESYQDIPYLIICPQFVKNFPPVYFVFQMEQTVSSRWFTKEYFVSLQNSCVILDYALQNVEFFHRPENEDIRSRVYYLPLDYYPQYIAEPAPKEKEYDVLFYGSISGDRRAKIFDEIRKKYRLKIISDLFGEELYEEIRKAKVVVNIHYYEGALIETTRLFEVLSLNSSVVVSEDSFDKNELGRLEDFVDFVPVDDVNKLLERIGYWLSHDEERREKVRANRRALEHRANAFDFFFYRFLLAYDRIDFDTFYRLAGNYVQLNTNKVCLSLPESTARRRSFDEDNKYGFQCIPGLRHEKGWVGCGLSYKLIFHKATEARMKNIMICEDDVIFPADFAKKLQQIMKYLGEQKRWSVFSGVMADVGNVTVKDCKQKYNAEFAQIDHMVSTVFNIYNKEMFKVFCQWDEANRDVTHNAIDRYLEQMNLAIYVQVPYLVGHKEELNSTIWGFSNTQYADMITNSENKLNQLIAEFKSKKLSGR